GDVEDTGLFLDDGQLGDAAAHDGGPDATRRQGPEEALREVRRAGGLGRGGGQPGQEEEPGQKRRGWDTPGGDHVSAGGTNYTQGEFPAGGPPRQTDDCRDKVTSRGLVPRLRLGTHCLRGSASHDAGECAAVAAPEGEAEPREQRVPRQSLGTRNGRLPPRLA